MKVIEIDCCEANDKLDFQANVFTSPGWSRVFGSNWRTYGVIEKDEFQALFSLQILNKLGMTVIQQPPLTPHCGLVLRSRSGNTASLTSWRKNIIDAIAEFIERLQWSVISISFPTWITYLQPFIWRGFKVHARYTYQIALKDRDDDTILAEMSQARRKQIRNGHKKGFKVERCMDNSIVEQIHEKIFKSQNKNYDHRIVHKVLHEFANQKNSFTFATYINDKPVAAYFCVHDSLRAYLILGGVDDENSGAAAGPMATFASIKHSRELGLEIFDFEGSIIPRIDHYNRNFGAQLTPTYRVVKAKLPIELLLKPFKRSLF